MTAVEYIQLKAFARQDGALLSVLWIVSFVCYIVGLTNPSYGMAALLLTAVTPFFVARRLRSFRDEALEGVISFMRAWGYAVLVFFYAGVLFAIIQYVYLAYFDSGYLVASVQKMMEAPETAEAIKNMGMDQTLSESLNEMVRMRPIDVALNMLTTNIMIGCVLGMPIAAVMYRKKKQQQSETTQ